MNQYITMLEIKKLLFVIAWYLLLKNLIIECKFSYVIRKVSLQHISKRMNYDDHKMLFLSNKWIVSTNENEKIVGDIMKTNNFINRGQNKRLCQRDFQVDTFALYTTAYGTPENFENIQEIYERKVNSIETSLRNQQQYEGILGNGDHIRSTYEKEFNDELWPLQWYEMGFKVNPDIPVLDMNLVPIYREYNFTGRGVNVVIIDDGIEYTHDDIRDNFDPEMSFNLNLNKTDITPRYEDLKNRHGTRCAGVIVMKANNGKCGVGIAHGAKVGGVTLLDGPTDDLMEARAVTFAIDKVDIYSGSWGPQDNGQSLDGPGLLVSAALHLGVTKGRKGRGALYVFAAGNGGIFNDHCGADGYINSIYSIAVASATQNGGIPYYGERCPAIIATTYSGNKDGEVKIVTTDIYNRCTIQHSGTSASAPLASGILALVLEANELLTWRDVQHLLVSSSEVSFLTPNVDWAVNGFGFWYSPQFGFGLINAYKLVTLARNWKTVPRKYVCSVPFNLGHRRVNRKFSSNRAFTTAVNTEACNFTIQFVEHVQLNVTIAYQVRGNLQIELISPYGTVSKLMEPRKHDKYTTGFRGWTFMSMQFWGEQAVGTWAVVISDQNRLNAAIYRGVVDNLQLILHGTKDIPNHYLNTHTR